MPKTRPEAAPHTDSRDAYHHGALREALIAASETLLAERGLEGFSLREVARRSGVSPGAPAHHFGDMNGLLAAVATLAFEELAAALEAGNRRGGTDPVARLREQGIGYVDFALRYPGRFGLMFRAGLPSGEPLDQSGKAAYALLENGVRDLLEMPAGQPLDEAQRRTVLALWSVVHGFAHLASANQFNGFAAGMDRTALLQGTLAPMLETQLRAWRPRS